MQEIRTSQETQLGSSSDWPMNLGEGPVGGAAEDRGEQAMAAVGRVAGQDRGSHHRRGDGGEERYQQIRMQCTSSSGSRREFLQVELVDRPSAGAA